MAELLSPESLIALATVGGAVSLGAVLGLLLAYAAIRYINGPRA